jgi:transcriptional regulator with XRE-family HTH domain
MLICHLEKKIKASGLRKQFIADHINVTVRQLRKYEKMESVAPIDKAYMLADLLNCTFQEIYEWKKDK